MKFTFDAYFDLLHCLRRKGYVFTDYRSCLDAPLPPRCVILRHDIDFSLSDAVSLSEREGNEGIPSFWFILLKTDFYNPFTTENVRKLRLLQKNGGSIGLHFDESQYAEQLLPLLENGAEEEYRNRLTQLVRSEIDLLSGLLGTAVQAVSMHCPSAEFLKREVEFPGIVNAYGRTFFRDFKYLSDSSRHWREDVERIVSEGAYPRLQILTHAFWYGETETGLKERLLRFCRSASRERYASLKENFNGLHEVLQLGEVCENDGGS